MQKAQSTVLDSTKNKEFHYKKGIPPMVHATFKLTNTVGYAREHWEIIFHGAMRRVNTKWHASPPIVALLFLNSSLRRSIFTLPLSGT